MRFTAVVVRRCVFVLTVFIMLCGGSLNAQVVISQVYGGGGNAGATLKNDYIEIFNRGASPESLAGWSVQYASSTGSSWQVTPLSGNIQPGQYYLVQEAAGAAGTANLPTPNVTGTINMSGTVGKVALMNTATLITSGTVCPSGATVVDFVGFGTGTNCFEGSGPTATLTNTTSALRKSNGCTDSNSNSADFATGAPNPRNTSSATNPCGGTNPSGTGLASPVSVQLGGNVVLTVTVTPGTGPTSTGLTVAGNLSTIGGSATQAFLDDGLNGDAAASDNVFSFQTSVAAGTSVGAKSIPVTINDAQARSGSTSISLTVTTPSTPPAGVGSATPSSVKEGETTLLTVNVTPGANPVSTGLSVIGNLQSIGGSASEAFHDDGLNGDAIAGDDIFSFQRAVASGTSPGAKSLQIIVGDAQARSSITAISLTVQSPPPPTTIKISQVYGGGGNSGSTYKNDFIEIFNQSQVQVDVTGWSVQYSSATLTTWTVTNICPSGPCIILPGHYFLIQESQGAGGTTLLPTPDAAGAIAMSGTQAKVALVAGTTPLIGACGTGGAIVDFVGYGVANCSEAAPTPVVSATTAAVRKGNGCIDTDNNLSDFVIVGPIPRNSTSPANSCGGDPGQPSGNGIATPGSLEPASNTLLTVKVTPASTPPSTNLTVTADLTSIGGDASQSFFDDGTHGDQTASDNVFSFLETVGAFISTGVKNVVSTITDAQSRTATAPITLTVSSPTCGVERWSVKTGTDADALLVNLGSPVRGQIEELGAIPAPVDPPGPPLNARVLPAEGSVYVVNATMTFFKKEDDVDYHIILQDNGSPIHTLIAEIPSPACVGASSPFGAAVASARAKFDSRFTANEFFQQVLIPVQVKGVGFFDFIHGQKGVAPNGIELHPLLEINFTANTITTLISSANPSQYGQSIAISGTVSNGEATVPTGDLSFSEGGNSLGKVALDQNGQATLNISTLSAGSHSITASYEGDSTSAPSTSSDLLQVVNKADQSINFGALAGKTYGDPAFTVSASGGGSDNPVTFVASGNCVSSGANGSTITITGAGSCTVTASQLEDSNYNAAPDVSRSFTINKRSASITISGYVGTYDGQGHGASGSATGINGEDLAGLLSLGAFFTDAPGGTANWSFAGNENYSSASGNASIAIAKATPTFSNLSSPVITTGTASTSLAGKISLGSLIPTGNVTITLNGITQDGSIQAGGDFSSNFGTTSLPPSNPPYNVTYSYGGDTNFNVINGAGTLTVGYEITPLFDQTKAAKSGSTIPIKLMLSNVAGLDVSSASVTVTAVQLVQTSSNATDEVQDSGNANPDNNFRFDPTLGPTGGYIYNLSTKGLAIGSWELIFTVSGDSTQHAVSFQIR